MFSCSKLTNSKIEYIHTYIQISECVLGSHDFGGGGDYGGDFGGGYGGGGDFGHHEEKTVTVVKKVPVPYPVTKEIPVPVEKKIPYPVKVPVPQPYPVEKKVLSNQKWYHFYNFSSLSISNVKYKMIQIKVYINTVFPCHYFAYVSFTTHIITCLYYLILYYY